MKKSVFAKLVPMVLCLCGVGLASPREAKGNPSGHRSSARVASKAQRAKPHVPRGRGAASNAVPVSTPCDALINLPFNEVADPQLVEQAAIESYSKNDPTCQGYVAFRQLAERGCEAAFFSAERGRTIGPGAPAAALASSMMKACALSKDAAGRGAAPVACDGAVLTEIAHDAVRAVVLGPFAGAAPVVLHTIETALVPRCRDDQGVLLALVTALQAADPSAKSPLLSIRNQNRAVPLSITDAALFASVQRFVVNHDPGPGGPPVIRAQAQALIGSIASRKGDRPWPLAAQLAARGLMLADAALGQDPVLFGYSLADLEYLANLGLLEQRPVVEAACTLQHWFADATIGSDRRGRLNTLIARLEPTVGRTPEGALLLFKLRAMNALADAGEPCKSVAAIDNAIAGLGRHGASLKFDIYGRILLAAAQRGRGLAMECRSGGAVYEKKLGDLIERIKRGDPWDTHVVFAQQGGTP